MGHNYDFELRASLLVSPPVTDEGEAVEIADALEAICYDGDRRAIPGIEVPGTEEPAFAIPYHPFSEIDANGNSEGAESNTPELVVGWLRVLAAVLAKHGRTLSGTFEGEPYDSPRYGDGSAHHPAFRITVEGGMAHVSIERRTSSWGDPTPLKLY